MDDKTMLELAARAAGVEFHGYDEKENCLFKRHKTSYGPGKSFWAPLTDDRDALRLAVRLHMKVYPGEAYAWEAAIADYSNNFSGLCDEDEEPDTYAATRRAIVRAAAEIGKGMGVGE